MSACLSAVCLGGLQYAALSLRVCCVLDPGQALETQQGVNRMKCLNSWALTAEGVKLDSGVRQTLAANFQFPHFSSWVTFSTLFYFP